MSKVKEGEWTAREMTEKGDKGSAGLTGLVKGQSLWRHNNSAVKIYQQ